MTAKKKKKAVKKKPAAKKRVLKKKPVARKKPVSKKNAVGAKKKPATKVPAKPVIGKITHFFPHVQAGVIKLKAPLEIGQAIKIKGHTSDFTQVVSSMQIDRVPVNRAGKGAEIGIKVNSRVRRGDLVFKV